QIRPNWAAWDTPHGRCEVSEEHGQVVVRWRHAAGSGRPGTRRRGLDSVIAEAALDERRPEAVDTAHTRFSPAAPSPSGTFSALAALFVLVTSIETEVPPADVPAQRLYEWLAGLRDQLGRMDNRPR